jgi:hypothetical protein
LRLFLLAALSAAGVALGLWIAGVFGDPHLRGSPTARFIVGWICVAFFGFAVTVALKRMVSGGDAITVDHRGILAKQWSEDIIPWSAIIGVSRRKFYYNYLFFQTYICLELENAKNYPSSNIVRRTGLDKAMGYGDVSFNAGDSDRSIDEVADAIDQYWRYFGRPASTGLVSKGS